MIKRGLGHVVDVFCQNLPVGRVNSAKNKLQIPFAYELVTQVQYRSFALLAREILGAWGDLQFSPLVAAAIRRVISITMSTVMDVTISASSGSDIRAILKLYDHRLGRDLGEIDNKLAAVQ